MSENYDKKIMSENFQLVYNHAEKLRFVGILTKMVRVVGLSGQ